MAFLGLRMRGFLLIWLVGGGLWTVDCGLWTVDCGLLRTTEERNKVFATLLAVCKCVLYCL
jgi:hypothetical protein